MKSGSLLTLGIPLFSQDIFRASRKFRICLNPGSIGVDADLEETLALAHRHGFESITAPVKKLAELTSLELKRFMEEMIEKQISWGAGGLPVQFRNDEPTFKNDLFALSRLAETAGRAGVEGLTTWIMPTHDSLTYIENFDLHVRRLREVARILNKNDLRLGLEYVGPRTLMSRDRFPFIGSMREAKELITAIDEYNVGLVLDSFHWYCAEESDADILTLDRTQIVTVDLNDAKAGRSAKEQLDNQRELPGISGVIDLEQFLGALVEIGYDGPVRAEPFNKELNEKDNEEAVQLTSFAMKKSILPFD